MAAYIAVYLSFNIHKTLISKKLEKIVTFYLYITSMTTFSRGLNYDILLKNGYFTIIPKFPPNTKLRQKL